MKIKGFAFLFSFLSVEIIDLWSIIIGEFISFQVQTNLGNKNNNMSKWDCALLLV